MADCSRQRKTLHSTGTRSSRSSGGSSKADTVEMKRKLMGLDEVRMKLRLTDSGMGIQEYTLCFVDDPLQEQGSVSLLPDFNSCLTGSSKPAFQKWITDSVNALTAAATGNLETSHEVKFRPPTAACANSKVVLCAESSGLASLILEHLDDDSDDNADWFELRLRGIFQVVVCPPSLQRGQHVLAPLPE